MIEKNMPAETRKRHGRKKRNIERIAPPSEDYFGALDHPFPACNGYDEGMIDQMHQTALDILENEGIKVLHPEARRLFKSAGASIDEESQMVWIGRDIITSALTSAPKTITMRGGKRNRDITLALGKLVFQPGAAAPYATDLERGRRIGSARDFRELVKLSQHFSCFHMMPPLVEPQDIAPEYRHYTTMDAMLTESDKVPCIFSRGSAQIEDGFEMIRLFREISMAEFTSDPWCYTIINTNSPRILDTPMAQGLIDFARARQLSIVTPFTLMGAMAPITVAGAMTLSHAEAMAAIALVQITEPGAPVCYGTFTSNVDMKSGAPAFGTPEHVRASLVAGQLARKIGLPWRCASGSAANINDIQAASETQFGLWGCLMAGATIIIHSAGWLEGGLTLSYEKLITDSEVLKMVEHLSRPVSITTDDIGYDAIAAIPPGGHFFGSDHTMARYQTEFYQHLVADLSNFGTWTDNGSIDTNHRATRIWKEILEYPSGLPDMETQTDRLRQFIENRMNEGGAPPVS